MHADAEFRISFFISFASGCDGSQRVDLLLFEIFQNPFEKFCPSVPWDSPVQHFWVIFAFLDFRVELGFRGRFLTVKPGSRLLGHPAGGRSILITSHQMLPYKIVSDSIFDLRADFRVSGRSPAVGPESSTIRLPETFP
jgi:hypothetical protein